MDCRSFITVAMNSVDTRIDASKVPKIAAEDFTFDSNDLAERINFLRSVS